MDDEGVADQDVDDDRRRVAQPAAQRVAPLLGPGVVERGVHGDQYVEDLEGGQFEEDGECEIDEWLLNYDLATELLNQFDEETSRSPLGLELGNGLRPLEVIRDLEETLESTDPSCIDDINAASKKYSDFISSVLRMELEYSPSPMVSANKAIKLKENSQTGLYYVGGDWIFSAPVPAGLNTYTALQDISGLFKTQEV